MKTILNICTIAFLALFVTLKADWNIYVWSSTGSINGQPGYNYSQTVNGTWQGGWQGYTANGSIIESHLDWTGTPSGPNSGGGLCGTAGIIIPCRNLE